MSFLGLPSKPYLHLLSPNLSPSVPQNKSGVVLPRLFTGHSFLSFLPFSMWPTWVTGFPDDSDGKESAYSTRDLGLIPRSGRSPGEGHGNPLQYSCLGNPMDRGPGGLLPMGSQRVGHNGATNTFQRVTEAAIYPQIPPHWQVTQFHHLLSPSVSYILFCR